MRHKRRAEPDLTLKPLAKPRRASLVAVILALTVLSAGTVAWAPWRDRPTDAAVALVRDRDTALDSGTKALVAFNTIDYRTIAKTTKGWLAMSTGALAQQVQASRKALSARSKRDQTQSVARVVESAVSSYDRSAGTASVMALLSIRTEKAGEKPVTNQSRFQVALQRIDSEWKVSHLQAVEVGR